MGYRLSVVKRFKDKNKNECLFYGTKMYGYEVGIYADEIQEKCKSCKYLIENKLIENDTFFDYGINNYVELNKKEVVSFLLLYIYDLINTDNFYMKDFEYLFELTALISRIEVSNHSEYAIEWV